MKHTHFMPVGYMLASLLSVSSCLNISQLNQTEQQSNLGELPISPSQARTDSTYFVSGIDSIFCDVPFDVFLNESSDEEYHIEGPSNFVQSIIVDTIGSNLYIKSRKEFKIMSKRPCKIYVSSNCLCYLELMNNGDGILLDYQTPKNLSFCISGCGNLQCRTIASPNLEVKLLGTGNIEIQKALIKNRFTGSVEGSGTITISDLKTNHIQGSISGAGNLTIRGKAKTANLEDNGMGVIDIEHLDIPSNGLKKEVSGLGYIKEKSL